MQHAVASRKAARRRGGEATQAKWNNYWPTTLPRRDYAAADETHFGSRHQPGQQQLQEQQQQYKIEVAT